jgi:hypothetical protein
MRTRIAIAATLVATLVIPSAVMAQDRIEAFQQQCDSTYASMMATAKVLIGASKVMAEARGLKDEVARLEKQLDDINKAPTKPTADGVKLLASAMGGQGTAPLDTQKVNLTEEQKAKFIAGIKEYMQGVGRTAALALEVPDLASAATETVSALASNPLKFRKVKDAVSAAKEMGTGLPGVAKGHAAVVVSIKNYVAKQGLNVDPSVFSFGKS